MRSVRGWLLQHLWYVQPTTTLTVNALPQDCLRALALATRPNLDRLHLRNLFTDGRRYYIAVRKEGFEMTSNTPVPWRRRARTSVAAILRGSFSASGGSTLIRLQARMRLLYLLDILPVPLFISSILIFTPWSRWLVTLLIIALFFLSWAGHRLSAALQAADMIYFVRTVLDDVTAADTPLVSSHTENVVTPEQDFAKAWQKFYEEHKPE